MSNSKITLTPEELHTTQVDEKVQQQAALTSAAENSQRAASTPSRLPVPEARSSIWYNSAFNMAVFGLLGGLLAWGVGEAVQYFNPNMLQAALDLRDVENAILTRPKKGESAAASDRKSVEILRESGRDNPWFQVLDNTSLSTTERRAEIEKLKRRDYLRTLIADVSFYCACGTFIALALGMADSVSSRNWRSAVIHAAVGALLGLCGGVVVALCRERIQSVLGVGPSAVEPSLARKMFARAVQWGILGVFISGASGVVMRNKRKLMFGLIGGLIGGLVGGALVDPVAQMVDGKPWLSRLVAIVAIGIITGLATGLIENAAKMGWLKVVTGLIAGKQFILYRNPTFIGAAPQCEIYLFKDGKVGRRHAAVYILPGYYDIEDLGTGTKTFVNGKPVTRTRLRSGDEIQIGATSFTFQEKARS